jgi:hypothetical protein
VVPRSITGVTKRKPMPKLPPPDPNEFAEPKGLTLSAPAAIFLAGPPSPEADRLSSAVLDWRPGVLIVAHR